MSLTELLGSFAVEAESSDSDTLPHLGECLLHLIHFIS